MRFIGIRSGVPMMSMSLSLRFDELRERDSLSAAGTGRGDVVGRVGGEVGGTGAKAAALMIEEFCWDKRCEVLDKISS